MKKYFGTLLLRQRNFHHRLHAHKHLSFCRFYRLASSPVLASLSLFERMHLFIKTKENLYAKLKQHFQQHRHSFVTFKWVRFKGKSVKKPKRERETVNVISYALSCILSPDLNIRVMPSFPFRQIVLFLSLSSVCSAPIYYFSFTVAQIAWILLAWYKEFMNEYIQSTAISFSRPLSLRVFVCSCVVFRYLLSLFSSRESEGEDERASTVMNT